MEAHKEPLSKILSLPTRLVAPLFQRQYVWNQNDNWEPLWEALVEVLDRKLTPAKARPYFMGAIVLDKIKGQTGSVSSREIIDGQQRMTTLQILLEAARRVFMEAGFDHQANQLRKLTYNDLDEPPDSEEQFKVWPTNVDRETFRNVMTGRPATGLMAQAFHFFEAAVRFWLALEKEGARERAGAFVRAVNEDLIFVAIDLNDEDDDGQLIFETLNALGTPLLPSDLVKNFLFRAALGENLNTESLYAKYWSPFEQDADYWRGTVKIGRRDRTRIDAFLQYYLIYKILKEPNLAHQFRDYRDAFKDGVFGTVEQAVQDFALFASYYRQFDQASTGNLARLRYVLNVLDLNVPTSLVLGILANVADPQQRDRLLATLESYFVRRFLCCLLTKNYNLVVARLITTLKERGWTNEVLVDTLKSFEGNSTLWPDDGFVMWRVTERNSYRDLRTAGLTYVLARVEESLRSDRSEQPWSYRTPLTVEHIMPQSWEAHWPLPNPNDEEAKRRRFELNNRIGNLTVLTRKLNSTVSNSSWEIKKEHLNDYSVLLLNSEIAKHPTWTEEDIFQRSEDLGRRFCNLWPRG